MRIDYRNIAFGVAMGLTIVTLIISGLWR